jgi:hypothetical protein
MLRCSVDLIELFVEIEGDPLVRSHVAYGSTSGSS